MEITEKINKHAAWLRGEPDGERADLRGANLSSADLRYANLRGALLDYRVLCLGPIGSRRDYLVYKAGIDEAMTGCFRGTLDEFENRVASTHGDNQHGRDYAAAIAFIRTVTKGAA